MPTDTGSAEIGPGVRERSWAYAYVALVLLLSWTYTIWLFANPAENLRWFVYIMLLPGLLALVFSALQYRSLRTLFQPLLGRLRLSAVLFSFLYPLVFIAACAGLALIFKLAEFHSDRLPSLVNPIGSVSDFAIDTLLILGEEYGWRGYLLPTLTRARGMVYAVIVVGLVWAVWHGPIVFMLAGYFGTGAPLMVCFVQMAVVFVFSFPFAYAYYRTGSIIPPMILHYVWNLYNPTVLGNIYRNQPGILSGKIAIINGEGVFGLLLGLVFAVWFLKEKSVSSFPSAVDQRTGCFRK